MGPPTLTPDQVIVMRALRLHNKTVYTGGKLGQIFGIHRSGAEKAVNGKTWKNIPFPIQPYASQIAEKFISERMERQLT